MATPKAPKPRRKLNVKETSPKHPTSPAYSVKGLVTGVDGQAIRSAEVKVCLQRIRDCIVIGTGKTTEQGEYCINYHFRDNIKEKPLIIVEANSEQLKKPLKSSPILGQFDQKIDLTAQPQDSSEFTTLSNVVQPLLEKLNLSDLVENEKYHDISFLSQETGKTKENITRLAISARLEEANNVPAAIFYAFIRQQIPSSLPSQLLEASDNFKLIGSLTHHIASLIFALTPELQAGTIKGAVKKNIIGSKFESEIPKIVSILQRNKVTNLLKRPYLVGKTNLDQLLTIAGTPPDKQQIFSKALTENQQSMAKFWIMLRDGKHGFTPEEASSIERTLSIGVFVKNHEPLLQLLLQRFKTGAVTNLSDLARLSLKDWENLVNQSGPPPNIDPAGTQTPSEVFARIVYTRVTRAFPTEALASRVLSSNLVAQPEQRPLNHFFSNNSNLDLLKHNVNTYLNQEGEKAFKGISSEDRKAVISNVKRMQRVLFVTPEADSAQTLISANIRSATQIAMMGRNQFFIKGTQAGLTKPEANQIYNTAIQRYSGLVALYMQLNRDALGVWPKAVGDLSVLEDPISQAVDRDQSLSTLFGSQDYCRVNSCTSVLSPAAYLCDLLYWLHNRFTGSKSALDILKLRRPDIGNLKLNCPNTETSLPYIDLVNEILSDAISPPTDPNSKINPPYKQTTEEKTAAELRAAPEYFNQTAFTKLFAVDYPHSLPYSEGIDELRAYLQSSSIALWQLRKSLLPLHNPTLASQVAVAAERFTMIPHDVELITNANFVPLPIAWHTSTPATDLLNVSDLMKAASITYDQLLELLKSQWVQNGLGIDISGINDTCDISVQSLTPSPLDGGFLDRAHRFLRLWHKTGYQMWELDMLLQSAFVLNKTLDSTGLVALNAFRLLQDETKLPCDAQLAWFQNMDTTTHLAENNETTTPLFSRVFLNPAIASLHPDSDLSAVSGGTAISDGNLNHHLDAIQTALGISRTDMSTLVTLFGLDAANTLTLDNLTMIYRTIQLASVSKLSIQDLAHVAIMINPTASSKTVAITAIFGNLSTATSSLQQIKSIQKSGFNIDGLMYLLTPPAATAPFWTTNAAMTDASITASLAAVRQAILNPSGGDLNGNVIAAVASQLNIPNSLAAFVMQTINVPGTATTILTVLTDAALTIPPGGPYQNLTRANYPNQFYAIQLLDKIRVIVQRLHLIDADLIWLINNSGVYGGLNFKQLPVTTAQPVLAVGPLLTTVLLVKLARLFTSASPSASIQTLYDLMAQVNTGSLMNEADTQVALSTITGWPLDDIVSLALALGVIFGPDYLSPSTYDALRTIEAMISAMSGKANGAQLISWAVVPSDEVSAENLAASALSVLKARYSNPDWLTAAPDIINPFREHRSAALQDYLVGNGNSKGDTFLDLNDLFDHFLIDTQMSSCEVTTRVVQAEVAVQIFVERCRMNLESPSVNIDPTDDAWDWWEWMKRYRIWEASRQVFLYPENWLIESQRPSRTEIYKKLEQDVHQGENTTDYFETVSLNYIDGLDQVANLFITGTCQDPITKIIHVIGRTQSDPPRFYHRKLKDGEWTGWILIPLDIKSHHVIPAVYRSRICLFWPEVKVHNEPHQNLPVPQPSSTSPGQEVSKYVSIDLHFTIYRNEAWAPAQNAKGKMFDIPILTSESASDSRTVEALYTLKVQSPPPSANYGSSLFIDVFRLGDYQILDFPFFFGDIYIPWENNPGSAVHVGRAVFDGRFGDLELNNLEVFVNNTRDYLLAHSQKTYGPDAQNLLPLTASEPDLLSEPGLVPKAGGLATQPPDPNLGNNQTLALNLTSIPLEQNAGPLLNTAQVPFSIVGPSTNTSFDPTSFFFYQDNRRCYYVETQRWYWTGSAWSPTVPSNPGSAPFEARYYFHRFYHPYTRLLWHQLASSSFAGIYNITLQQNPDQLDPSKADVFNFQNTYQPIIPRVTWGENNEILDFLPNAAYHVYNWEVFFHIPLYISGLLSQNQKFEDALKWFHYIFDPTRQGTDPAPQRFWNTKPLHELTKAEILAERINNLLQLINQRDPNALAQVRRWRNDPFNPFLLADIRPVAYMKTVTMKYLDNIIDWADNLFSTDSREALSEATLLFIIAAEILGPQPSAITPAKHADSSYNELEPKLDDFVNAMVEIENVMGEGGGGMGGGGTGIPGPQTFYFKIPPNEKLLEYWNKVGDRLFKLRHCQNIQGVTRELALFDAPIDPGLLIKAQAAGIDLSSVLKDVTAPLPNYRYTSIYTQALDFVNAVRAYGTSLQSAIEKSDGAALAVLQQTIQLDMQHDMDQIFQMQIEKIEHDIEALQHSLAISQSKYDFNTTQPYMNAAEWVDFGLGATIITFNAIAFVAELISAGLHNIPDFVIGVSGFGGTPAATASEGGPNFGNAAQASAQAGKTMAALFDKSAALARSQASYMRRKDNWDQAAREADFQKQQTQATILSNEVSLAIAQQNQINHEKQMEYIQKQIDFLTNKFSNQDLYDWQVGQLADVYFQSYKLAFRLCKQVEKAYQYELGLSDSNFIQFGYWDSLHKGLLAGETLNNDLRRMHSSYLDLNKRRFEISRFISLATLNPAALQKLLVTGICDFDLPESLFDNDYPGHYNRHLTRVSLTVVYPSPSKFDNIKATLTLQSNKVRVSNSATSSDDYPENIPNDPRFIYNYGAVSQKIVLGNAQDDPGLFQTSISNNLSDQRYLPFEGAGAVSSWRLEMPEATNEIDLSAVSDVIIHLYYTDLDGGDQFKIYVEQNNLATQPTSGIRIFSARNDFSAPTPTVANPYPLSPWDAFLQKPTANDADQTLVLTISPSKFPTWTRGKTITVTGIALLSVSWSTSTFTLQPQAPLAQAPADMPMSQVAGATEPNICSATLAVPPNATLGKWTFKLKTANTADYQSLTKNDIGDVMLLVSFQVA